MDKRAMRKKLNLSDSEERSQNESTDFESEIRETSGEDNKIINKRIRVAAVRAARKSAVRNTSIKEKSEEDDTKTTEKYDQSDTKVNTKIDNKYGLNVDEQKIFDFFYNISRPVGNAELTLNFKKHISPSNMVTILTNLESKGLLIIKMYAKTKFYMINQSIFDTTETEEYEKKLKSLKEKVEVSKEIFKTKYAELQNINNLDTEEELESKLVDVQNKLKIVENRICMKDEGLLMRNNEVEEFEKKIKNLQKIKKERRKLVNNCLDLLIESLNMKKSEIIEDLDLDY